MSKKYKILYEPQMFDLQNYGGISRYFSNLIEGINKTQEFSAELPLVYSTNYYVRNFPQLMNNWIGRILLKKGRRRKNSNLFFAKHNIRKANFDILHATYYNSYFLKDLKKPLVLTVHDMIYENFPNLFEDAEKVINEKRIMIEAADLIIAISIFTKQELLRHYPDLSAKIKVVYHGLPDTTVISAKDKLPEKFLLYVGDRNALYKNFKPFIEAITPILNLDKSLHLICAGGGQFNQEELNLLDRSGIKASTTQLNATDSQIQQLYENALMFIYPSIEEGFGLPMLEAFKNGCAVACSETSCLPEVGGSAVSYFNPANVQSMNQVISTLINTKELRKQHIDEGHNRVKEFTFNNCLDQTLNCYKSLLKPQTNSPDHIG